MAAMVFMVFALFWIMLFSHVKTPPHRSTETILMNANERDPHPILPNKVQLLLFFNCFPIHLQLWNNNNLNIWPSRVKLLRTEILEAQPCSDSYCLLLLFRSQALRIFGFRGLFEPKQNISWSTTLPVLIVKSKNCLSENTNFDSTAMLK